MFASIVVIVITFIACKLVRIVGAQCRARAAKRAVLRIGR